MNKADKLRKQRAEYLDKRREQRDQHMAARKAVEDKIAAMQAELAAEQSELEKKGRAIDLDIAHLDVMIRDAEAVQKIEELKVAARELDIDGHSPERLRIFERLCCELSAPLVGRFSLRSYEARQMVFRRMKRDAEVAMFGPPYPTWSALVQACIRPGQQEAA
jgi:hypothetical protein